MREKSAFSDQFACHINRINEELGKALNARISLIEEVGIHSLLAGGKRLRALFFILSCQLCNYRNSDIYPLSTIFECLHAASLLHDAALDRASITRGRSSTNMLCRYPAALLAGDFLFSKSSGMAVDKKHIAFLKIITDAVTRMTEGQVLELINTHNWNITGREYIRIVTLKTAALISAACATGGIVAGAKQAMIRSLENFGLNMGIAFQIVDDIIAYTSTAEESATPISNDVRCGKVTLPLIYSLTHLEKRERNRLEHLFKSGKASEKDYLRITELIQDNGAINKCCKDARGYGQLAETHLSRFPDSPIKQSLLELCQSIVNRTY